MRRVYKYPFDLLNLGPGDTFCVEMPRWANVLCVQAQREQPTLWAMVDPAESTEKRFFRVAGTGHPVDEQKVDRYVGTFQMRGGDLVFHVWEVSRG